MTIIKEFRIHLPFTLEQYQIGSTFSIAKASEEEDSSDGGGDRVEVRLNEKFEKDGKEGIHTHKTYHLANRLPTLASKVLPGDMMQIHEESWNAFPYCLTKLTSPYFGERFLIEVESIHIQDTKIVENALNLTYSERSQREVVNIDIGHLGDGVVSEEMEPANVKLKKASLGPLTTGWQHTEDTAPRMVIYKVVRATAQWWPFSGLIEGKIDDMHRNLFAEINKKIYSWGDLWWDLSLEEVHRYDRQVSLKLKGDTEKKKKHEKERNKITEKDNDGEYEITIEGSYQK
eukprot:gb/GECH01003703.1/.p1 GENE.gb/GECH01003703.1/~~gb/GECH01003703.1/.p1  ORF type:complete len:288 (+),score=93.94 gb/GECH01003703.1/:1-864(+)